jgi:hypothetical protein
MNADALRVAYEQFVAEARAGFPLPPEGQWGADQVLAHVVVGDRLVAQAAADVLAGRPVRYDNRASQSEPYLRAVIDAAGDWDGLVDAVRWAGRELVSMAEQTSDEQAATEVHIFIVSGGEVVVDEDRPLSFLLQGTATVHLPIHAAQLAALRAGESG